MTAETLVMPTAEIVLTRGLVALVDEADAEFVLSFGKWTAHPRSDGLAFYALKNDYSGPRQRQLRMHNVITGWAYVDHRNGDGLDNRRANLRESTHAANLANSRLRSDNQSGWKGVQRRVGRRGGVSYRARIVVGGALRNLGQFATPEEAARAYDAAATETWGEFASVNFPAPGQRGARP